MQTIKGAPSYHWFTVATLPTTTTHTTLGAGDTAYASSALKASETTGNLVFFDVTNWCRVDTGATAGA